MRQLVFHKKIMGLLAFLRKQVRFVFVRCILFCVQCVGLKMAVVLGVSTLLTACGGPGNYADLESDIARIKATPKQEIDPLPTFRPYKPFVYSAAALRSPFEPPIKIKAVKEKTARSDVKPDMDRVKEYLEEFPIGTLKMVGTIAKDGQLWGLIRSDDGSVYRVRPGNYMGRNHGRITLLTESQIELVEIVPDGQEGGWIERPRVMKIRESNG